MNSRQKILIYTVLIYSLILVSTVIFNQQIAMQAKLAGQSPFKQEGIGYVFYLLASIIIANFIIIILSAKFKKLIGIFLNGYVMFAMILSIMILADIYLFWLTPLGVLASIIMLSVMMLYLYLNKRTRYKYFNIFGIMLAIGLGTAMSVSVTPLIALILLIFLSIYDYIAVFITKNMLRLLEIVGTNALPMFIVAGDVEILQERTANIYCNNCMDKMHTITDIEDIILDNKLMHLKCDNCGREVYVNPKDANDEIKIVNAGHENIPEKPKPDISALGLGDLIIPALLISSIAIDVNILWGIAMLIGGVIGMIANMYVLNKLKRPLPALPLICVGMVSVFGLMILSAL